MTGPTIVAVIGLLAIAAGSFLDWVAVELPGIEALLARLPNAPESLALKGIDFMQGKALIGLGVVGAIAVLVGRKDRARRVASLVAVAVAGGAIVLAGTDVAEIIRIPEVPIPQLPPGGLPQGGQAPPEAQAILQQIGGGTLSVEVGIGLWLVLLGGLAALGSGIAIALARDELPSYPPTPARRLPQSATPQEPPAAPEPPPAPRPPKREPGEGPPPAWTPT